MREVERAEKYHTRVQAIWRTAQNEAKERTPV